jgi:MFS transporter, DHA1 family, tetracycline resistance protein
MSKILSKILSKENERLAFIIVTIFLNFLGFSIVIPILPFLVARYINVESAIALNVGFIVATYAICQFFAAPGLGALADRFGRRPILLVSLTGSIVGYLILALGGGLWALFLGRIIDGLTGGNISTVYAYVADITEPKDRGKYYGLLGAAGGFGFMVGPAIGGFAAHFNLVLPLFLAAGITLASVIWGYFVLPESLHEDNRTKTINIKHLNPFSQFGHIFDVPALRRIFIMSFIFFLGLVMMQTIQGVFYKDVFKWQPLQIGMILFYVGVIDIISQGFIVRKLLTKYTDVRVSEFGLIMVFLGMLMFCLNAIYPSVLLVVLSVTILITGDGLFEPSASSMIANSVDGTMQGRVQGASMGMQSLTRVIGPLIAATIYAVWRGFPYLAGAVLMIIALGIIISSRSIIHEHKATFN